MILLDVNVFVYAYREDLPRHDEYRGWLEEAINSPQPYAVSEAVLASFIRVVTHPRLFKTRSDLESALSFTVAVRSQPNVVIVAPGPRNWELFADLCRSVDVRGNLVADAYLAALAIESGSELITTDRDFARFPGLRWRHPLD
ncbi:MAG: type II toxin-antitoxin system VapC family toxin [Thermoleophilia bacterium]|nr:type II toxin-antitoxin system VapC family toxin [Thermoleophilia bacterium]